jgi:GTP-binding protein HflX
LSGAARRKADVPTVSLVGYTNAGKSTLFNSLTGAHAYAASKLFATLDPTLRRLPLSGGSAVILADTVGFIRDLPHDLVAAFHATLEQTRQARLLLHVIDAADPERIERIRQVDQVLEEIEADKVPQIEVLNKIDLRPELRPRVDRNGEGRAIRVYVSARTGAGLDLLRRVLEEELHPDVTETNLFVADGQGALRARLFELGAVQQERPAEGGSHLSLRLPRATLERLCADAGVACPPEPHLDVAAAAGGT